MAFSSFIYTGIQCSISECHPSSWEEWWGETASAKPHWQHHLHGVHVHNSGTVWKGQTHLHLTSHIPGTGIYLECWEYRGFPTPWGWFPLPRISKVYIENSTKVLERVWFPFLKNQQLIILYKSLCVCTTTHVQMYHSILQVSSIHQEFESIQSRGIPPQPGPVPHHEPHLPRRWQQDISRGNGKTPASYCCTSC